MLKTVIQAVSTYAMNVFLFPKELCAEIERIMNGTAYWWHGNDMTGRGIRWKSWQSLCKPKEKGGLGFRPLRYFNLAMLGKQAWRLITNPDSFVRKIYKARYFPNYSFLHADVGINSSFIWSSIVQVGDVMTKGLRRRIGNGHRVSVWREKWLPGDGDDKIITPPPAGIADMNVAALMTEDDRTWNFDRINNLFSVEERNVILLIPVSRKKTSDGFLWQGDPRGIYTVKSGYRMIRGECIIICGSWSMGVIPCISI
ncbi:unnamed protein product [Cuscuta europaea]|uniref:Uncharacterized protein n=1 Tax=Cuscuta europaea TaxID=41803 RepID=A0A9P1EAG0_CUSEU|nr:unnamed protein product [Cuscuta europaea]